MAPFVFANLRELYFLLFHCGPVSLVCCFSCVRGFSFEDRWGSSYSRLSFWIKRASARPGAIYLHILQWQSYVAELSRARQKLDHDCFVSSSTAVSVSGWLASWSRLSPLNHESFPSTYSPCCLKALVRISWMRHRESGMIQMVACPSRSHGPFNRVQPR
jgi:hypothetical protein